MTNQNSSAMRILSHVKTLLLDFAQKTAEAKCNNEDKSVLEAIKNDFVNKMLQVRDLFPSMLFINYDKISEKDAELFYKKLKEYVSNNYCIDGISSPTFMPINVDGTKIEIPGFTITPFSLYEEYVTINVVRYDTVDTKRSCMNLTVLNAMMSLPIKKMNINFVDLKGDFDAELLLRNLPKSLYHEHPVTTERQLDELLDRMEKRRDEIITKYGDYPKWCKNNNQIPQPYEMIVFYDESYDAKYLKRLDALINYGARIGVYLLFTEKASAIAYGPEPNMFDMIKKEAFVKKYKEDNCYYISSPYTGLHYEGYPCSLGKQDFISYILCEQMFKDDGKILKGGGDYELMECDGNILGAYSTIEECKRIKQDYRYVFLFGEKMTPTIALQHYEKESGFWTSKYAIEFVVETNKTNIILDYFYDDLLFYLTELEIPIDLQQRIIEIMKGEIMPNSVTELQNGDAIHFRYWNEVSKDEAQTIRDGILVNINNKAKKKWGKEYNLHLCIDGSLDYDAKCFVIKRNHIRIPIEHFEIPKNDGIINFTPITSNETLLKACFDYIRTEAEAKEEMKVQNLDFGSAAENKYETDLSTMVIPVGKAESKDADFRMDLVSHVHSFIIGQSGSGKSVFLHNIIGGAMLKYAPEDLQLYLLDFKLGGVEFNRYKGAKHVKALLVDNSDPQVTLEILRELRGSMAERGKLLRSAGVNNIGEYNKLHQEDRMPHVLVVADECHEMFKADDSIPRQVRNEISDIVIKIAKEGRSQGVHLVFATQTLSGTEISSEIINNVSDFYLLKCAQTDSERLVPNSSAITSELSTGQIYYHHVDEQVKFQAYYTDKEAAEKLMAAIVEKAKDHKSNGEFYFNGAQMFYLDESVKEQIQNVKGKSPVAFMGKAIDISQKDLYIKLNEDFSENVLLLGLNDQEQVTRTTLNLFVSLMMSAKLKHKDIAFKVIDCLNNEEGEVHELIFDLENEGYCEIIERRQRSKFFKNLAQGVLDGTTEETILLVLGQDRFRELKMDMELEDVNNAKQSDDDDMMSISDDFFGGGSSSSLSVKTYKDALNVILEKGPDYGVHTLLQLEKASNLLFEDYITPKVVFQKFKHLVMLKSDETAGVTLHLNDDICLEKLSSDWERLRAYYYAEESDSYTLFTPYMPSKSKDIIKLL